MRRVWLNHRAVRPAVGNNTGSAERRYSCLRHKPQNSRQSGHDVHALHLLQIREKHKRRKKNSDGNPECDRKQPAGESRELTGNFGTIRFLNSIIVSIAWAPELTKYLSSILAGSTAILFLGA